MGSLTRLCTDRPYGNAFVFITYVKPFAIKL